MKYMLDTNICIYLIKKKPEAVLKRLMNEEPENITVSVFTQCEMEFGIEKSSNPDRNRMALTEFLAPLTVLPYPPGAALHYGQVRAFLEKSGKTIGSMDLLIASHALSMGLTLVTNNVREFSRIEGLSLENWTELASA